MKLPLISFFLFLTFAPNSFAQDVDVSAGETIGSLDETIKQVSPILDACDEHIQTSFSLTGNEIASSMGALTLSIDTHVLKGVRTLEENEHIKLMVVLPQQYPALQVLGKTSKWEKGLKLALIGGDCYQLGSYVKSIRGGKRFNFSKLRAVNFREAMAVRDYFEKFWGTIEFENR